MHVLMTRKLDEVMQQVIYVRPAKYLEFSPQTDKDFCDHNSGEYHQSSNLQRKQSRAKQQVRNQEA